MQCTALNPSPGMHLWGDSEICSSPGCLGCRCRTSLACGEVYMLHANLAVCLEVCVLSCQYVEPKQNWRHGPWARGGKEMYLVLSMRLCLWGTSQYNWRAEATLGCGRAMSFFLKHACADRRPLDAAVRGEKENRHAYLSGDGCLISQKGHNSNAELICLEHCCLSQPELLNMES